MNEKKDSPNNTLKKNNQVYKSFAIGDDFDEDDNEDMCYRKRSEIMVSRDDIEAPKSLPIDG